MKEKPLEVNSLSHIDLLWAQLIACTNLEDFNGIFPKEESEVYNVFKDPDFVEALADQQKIWDSASSDPDMGWRVLKKQSDSEKESS
jgi:hypothetical protein